MKLLREILVTILFWVILWLPIDFAIASPNSWVWARKFLIFLSLLIATFAPSVAHWARGLGWRWTSW